MWAVAACFFFFGVCLISRLSIYPSYSPPVLVLFHHLSLLTRTHQLHLSFVLPLTISYIPSSLRTVLPSSSYFVFFSSFAMACFPFHRSPSLSFSFHIISSFILVFDGTPPLLDVLDLIPPHPSLLSHCFMYSHLHLLSRLPSLASDTDATLSPRNASPNAKPSPGQTSRAPASRAPTPPSLPRSSSPRPSRSPRPPRSPARASTPR